ncbi:hypothetical protein GCM10009745_16560 [Kribbella yunnanensis]|uniref:Uncharacterized protein n=1 Tax=Kribbella yunnanensis TaxID=190194 RepID=A0ABP4SKA7_9ACTN
MASALLDAAIEHARASGAKALDAFPKTNLAPHTLSNPRAEENDSWMGRRASYEARGFVSIRSPGARAVMRLHLAGDEQQYGEGGFDQEEDAGPAE